MDQQSLSRCTARGTIAGGCHVEQNVGEMERIGSAVAGGALLLCALRPKFLPPAVWTVGGAALGVGLLVRAVTGHCSVYRAMGVSTAGSEPFGRALESSPSQRDGYSENSTFAAQSAAPAAATSECPTAASDRVDEASWESFPASDPPSSIVGGVGTPQND